MTKQKNRDKKTEFQESLLPILQFFEFAYDIAVFVIFLAWHKNLFIGIYQTVIAYRYMGYTNSLQLDIENIAVKKY